MGVNSNWSSNAKAGAYVFGLYSEFPGIRGAARQLRQMGFRAQDISFLFPETALSVRSQSSDSTSAEFHTEGERYSHLIGGTSESLGYINTHGTGVIAEAIMSLGLPGCDAEQYENEILAGKLLICARSFSEALGDLAMHAVLHAGGECVIAVPWVPMAERLIPITDFRWSEVKSLFQTSLIC